MAIHYKLVNRDHLKSASNKTREYPHAIKNNTISPDDFLEQFAATSKFSEADAIYLILCLKQYIVEQIKNGNIVQTRHLGTFYPVVKAGKDKNLVPSIRYRPSKEMKKEILRAETKRIKG